VSIIFLLLLEKTSVSIVRGSFSQHVVGRYGTRSGDLLWEISQVGSHEQEDSAGAHCLGQPDDIANVISFLAGPNGGGVNSQGVRVNGGFANPFETQAGTTGRAPINTKEKLP
jgi:hypothetical protein